MAKVYAYTSSLGKNPVFTRVPAVTLDTAAARLYPEIHTLIRRSCLIIRFFSLSLYRGDPAGIGRRYGFFIEWGIPVRGAPAGTVGKAVFVKMQKSFEYGKKSAPRAVYMTDRPHSDGKPSF